MKDIISTLEMVEEKIDRLANEGIYEIERDLLLERLRNLYTKVLTAEPKSEEIGGLDAFFAMQALEEVEVQSEEMVEEFVEESAEEPATEDVVEEEPVAPEEKEVYEEPEVVVKEEDVDVEEEVVLVEEPVAEDESEEELMAEEESLEEKSEEVVVSMPVGEIDHRAAMSLYDDEEDEVVTIAEDEAEDEATLAEEAEEEESETIEEEEQSIEVIENGGVLAEVLAAEQVTVADRLAEQSAADVATAATASLSLRQAIGVNDKFILMRDLFAGNGYYYAEAIDKLDSFENLDEAMLYIYDNFHWNPNSEGARLLMELLARKLF